MSPLAHEPDRLADALTALAARVPDAGVRAQLHALAGIVRNADRQPVDTQALTAALDDAVEREDEPAAIAAMRRLAAAERAGLRAVDWSAASGG
jgi:hypothetical protein